MDRSARRAWQVRLAAVAIFVLGFAAGALALSIYRSVEKDSSASERHNFDQTLEQLNLTAEQQVQVKEIFDEARAQMSEVRREYGPKFHEVRERTDTRLREVLTPEQWEQFKSATDRGGRHGHHRRHRGDKEREP
jgi:Spy/CpxP family protein refolding chaperone